MKEVKKRQKEQQKKMKNKGTYSKKRSEKQNEKCKKKFFFKNKHVKWRFPKRVDRVRSRYQSQCASGGHG